MTKQRDMCYRALSHPAKVYEAFMEIQQSGNPLTPEEVRALIKKRPEYYWPLEAYAAKETP